MGKGEACTGFWWGNLKERDHWGGAQCRRENNVKMNFQAVGCGFMDWIELVQDRDK
jgi:hypothetical protein